MHSGTLDSLPDLDYTEGLPQGMLDTLTHSASQQQLRQIRRIQQLTRQAELAYENRLSWEERERLRMAKEHVREIEGEKDREVKSAQRDLVERRRQAIITAAQEKAENDRRELQMKLAQADVRAEYKAQEKAAALEASRQRSATVDERRRDIKQLGEIQLEERRRALIARQMEAEQRLLETEKAREKEQELRRQEDEDRRKHRDETIKRAEMELHAKTLYFQKRQQDKERVLAVRKQEEESILQAKSEALRQRQDEIAFKVNEQAMRDEEDRAYRRRKFEDKLAKANRAQEQRDQVLLALEEVRKEMSMQEAALKQRIQDIERSGRIDELEGFELERINSQGVSTFLTALKTARQASARAKIGKKDSMTRRDLLRQSSSPNMNSPTSQSIRAWGSVDEKEGYVAPVRKESISKEQQLRDALDKEVQREIERQNLLSQVKDEKEYQDMQRAFTVERKGAMEHIDSLRGK